LPVYRATLIREMRNIPETKFRKMIEIAVCVQGSQKRLAAAMGVSESYLSDVITGRRDAGEKILKWFGLERVILYRRVDGGQL